MAMFPADATQVVGHHGGGQHNTATLPAIGRDPAELPRKRHRATYTLLALAVVAALVLVGLAGKSILAGDPPPPRIAVPSVLNLAQAEAEAKLRAAGFKTEASLAKNAAKKGVVVDQNPRPGEQLSAQGTVTITVSGGPAEVPVPEVRNFAEDSAKAALRSIGLTVGEVQRVEDPSVDKGKVIETVPPAGASVPAGSPVVLKVASGKVKVPSVVGEDRGAALQTLTDLKLKTNTTFKDSAAKPEGTVLSQNHVDESVDVGTVITLVVAVTPAPTAPPPTTPPSTPAPGNTATVGPPPENG